MRNIIIGFWRRAKRTNEVEWQVRRDCLLFLKNVCGRDGQVEIAQRRCGRQSTILSVHFDGHRCVESVLKCRLCHTHHHFTPDRGNCQLSIPHIKGFYEDVVYQKCRRIDGIVGIFSHSS